MHWKWSPLKYCKTTPQPNPMPNEGPSYARDEKEIFDEKSHSACKPYDIQINDLWCWWKKQNFLEASWLYRLTHTGRHDISHLITNACNMFHKIEALYAMFDICLNIHLYHAHSVHGNCQIISKVIFHINAYQISLKVLVVFTCISSELCPINKELWFEVLLRVDIFALHFLDNSICHVNMLIIY